MHVYFVKISYSDISDFKLIHKYVVVEVSVLIYFRDIVDLAFLPLDVRRECLQYVKKINVNQNISITFDIIDFQRVI